MKQMAYDAEESMRKRREVVPECDLSSCVMQVVFKFLGVQDLVRCSTVSKAWYAGAGAPCLWAELCTRYFQTPPTKQADLPRIRLDGSFRDGTRFPIETAIASWYHLFLHLSAPFFRTSPELRATISDNLQGIIYSLVD